MSLVCRKLIKPHGLAPIFRQSTAALQVNAPKLELTARVALIGGKLEEVRGLAIIFRHTPTRFAEAPKIDLTARIPLIGGKPKKPRGLNGIFQNTLSPRVAKPKIDLPVRVSLVGGQLKKTCGLAVGCPTLQ